MQWHVPSSLGNHPRKWLYIFQCWLGDTQPMAFFWKSTAYRGATTIGLFSRRGVIVSALLNEEAGRHRDAIKADTCRSKPPPAAHVPQRTLVIQAYAEPSLTPLRTAKLRRDCPALNNKR
ncbi:hypothetical protein VC273_02345 [Xanthomonas nasturtii]|uniref:hypothetical protein n=1 Tax=Xanthomonas sp. WHRI 10208 TaxID=3161564 RepID=UPI002B3EE51C|nr:hypothetical protein [Xanthomonas nasturtii]